MGALAILNCMMMNSVRSQTPELDAPVATYYYQKVSGIDTNNQDFDQLISNTTNGLNGAILTNKSMAFLSTELSTDFATLYLINELQKDDKNREAQKLFAYYDNLDIQGSIACDSMKQTASKEYILVFVPGLFYKRKPETGGDFYKQRMQFNDYGCTTHLIETNEVGTVEENAMIITQELRKLMSTGKKIIVVSASKGGLDLYYSLGYLLNESETENIRAWVSIGGTLNGSPIADKYQKGFRKLYAKIILRFIGARYGLVRDLGTSASAERNKKIKLPDNILTIHYVGAPLEYQLNKEVKKLYAQLSKLGPNDGLTTLIDELTDNGIVITELGLDHYYRDPNIDRKTIALLFTSLILLE